MRTVRYTRPMLPAIVLAAGRSSRFGRPKALARAAERPFISQILDALALAGVVERVVVCRDGDQELATEIARAVPPARVVVNPRSGPRSVVVAGGGAGCRRLRGRGRRAGDARRHAARECVDNPPRHRGRGVVLRRCDSRGRMPGVTGIRFFSSARRSTRCAARIRWWVRRRSCTRCRPRTSPSTTAASWRMWTRPLITSGSLAGACNSAVRSGVSVGMVRWRVCTSNVGL